MQRLRGNPFSWKMCADSRYLNALDAVRAELAVPMLVRGRLKLNGPCGRLT